MMNPATQYLASSVHLHDDLADAVAEEFLTAQNRAFAASDVDHYYILSETILARLSRRITNSLLVGILLATVPVAAFSTLQISIGFFAIAEITVLSAYSFVRRSAAGAAYRHAPNRHTKDRLFQKHFKAHASALARSRLLERDDVQRVILFHGERALVGTGACVYSRHIVLPVDDTEFSSTELYNYIETRLATTIFRPAVKEFATLSSRDAFQRTTASRFFAEELRAGRGHDIRLRDTDWAALREFPADWIRYYRAYQTIKSSEEYTVTVLLNVSCQDNLLTMEWRAHILGPIAEIYRPDHRPFSIPLLAAIGSGLKGLAQLPLNLHLRVRDLGLWAMETAIHRQQQRASSLLTPLLPPDHYGARSTLRELGVGSRFYSDLDRSEAERTTSRLERFVLDAACDYIRDNTNASHADLSHAVISAIDDQERNKSVSSGLSVYDNHSRKSRQNVLTLEHLRRSYALKAMQVFIRIGPLMSLGLIVLAATTPIGDNENGLQIAAIAAASLPVVGAVLTAGSGTELGAIANANLRRTLWTAQLLALLAVVSFVAAVAMGVAGLTDGMTAVYTALASTTLGGVSLLVTNRVKDAQQLAISVVMTNAIEDPALRDQVRAKIAIQSATGQAIEKAVAPTAGSPQAGSALDRSSSADPGAS